MQALVIFGCVVLVAATIGGAAWFEITTPDRRPARHGRERGWAFSARPDPQLRAVAWARQVTRRRLSGSLTHDLDGVEVSIFGWLFRRDEDAPAEGNTVVATRRPGRSLPTLELASPRFLGRPGHPGPELRPGITTVDVAAGASDRRAASLAADPRVVDLMREWPGLRVRSEGDELWAWRDHPMDPDEGRSLVPVTMAFRLIVEDLG